MQPERCCNGVASVNHLVNEHFWMSHDGSSGAWRSTNRQECHAAAEGGCDGRLGSTEPITTRQEMTMPTTDTPTNQPDRTATTTIPRTPGSTQLQRPAIDLAPARVGVAFAVAAAVGVGALVWAVIAGPTDTSVGTSTHDRVEQTRADTLRDLATPPTDPHDRVEQTRADTLRDLATQPTDPHDRVEQTRADTLRDLATQPTDPHDRVEPRIVTPDEPARVMATS
jgi:hypothetical protein